MWKAASKLTSKQRLLPLGELQEFEKRRGDLINHEKLLKKLHADTKNYAVLLETVFRSELRLLQNLRACNVQNDSNFTEFFDVWAKAVCDEDKLIQEYLYALNCVAGDSFKKLQQSYNLMHVGLKKWQSVAEQALKESEKLEKLKEKEKTTQNLMKIEQQEEASLLFKQDFDILHDQVFSDMRRLAENATIFIDPVLEAVISLFVDYNGKLQKLYSNLCSQLHADCYGGSDQIFNTEMQQKLAALKSLSIVAE